jgi:hypothetical protein
LINRWIDRGERKRDERDFARVIGREKGREEEEERETGDGERERERRKGENHWSSYRS